MQPQAPPPIPASESPGLVEAVMAGQRLVIVPYVFSVVILSFKRSMGGVHLVKTGGWPMGKIFGASCITALFGWIGMPMGIIWTVICLFYLWSGGKDVTRAVLAASVGEAEAKRILKTAPKPKLPASIWFVRMIIVIPMTLLTLLIFCILFPPPWV